MGSANAKKSPGAQVANRKIECKKSLPSHWYNGVAEDSFYDNQTRYATGGTWSLHIHVTMAML